MEKLFGDVVDIPKLSENQAKLCEKHFIEKNLYNSLKTIKSNKQWINKKKIGNVLERTEGNLCRFRIRS